MVKKSVFRQIGITGKGTAYILAAKDAKCELYGEKITIQIAVKHSALSLHSLHFLGIRRLVFFYSHEPAIAGRDGEPILGMIFMDEKELLKIIENDESETVEFKKSTAQVERALKAICAFLNHKGGIVLFGVEKKKIVGQEVSDSTLRSISQKIRQGIKPEVSPQIEILDVGGKKIIEVRVKEGGRMHYLDGVAYKRTGTENVAMPPDELERIILEKNKKYWDSQICEGANLDDIDPEKVKWFLRKAKYERNFDVGENTPVKESLERLELLKSGKLTNAAVLLFGKNPQKFFILAEMRCARFKGIEPVKPFIDMKVFGGSIIDQVDKAMAFALEHIPMKVYLVGKPEREERYEYPADAIREAIINAICHRDYQVPSNVQIRIFDDRIEVWGCGPLPEPLTPENLTEKHESVLRNPTIAKCFFLIKFIEQWGTGTNDIIRMCLDWGLPEPLFEEVAGNLVVTFRKSKLTEEHIEKLGLTERQKKAVEYMRENKKITSKVYATMFGITGRMARNDIQDLVAKKVIEKKGASDKTAYYVLEEI